MHWNILHTWPAEAMEMTISQLPVYTPYVAPGDIHP